MTNFIVLFLCLSAGWLCQRVSRFPPESGRALNSFVIYLSLPALVLIQFPKLLKSGEIDAGFFLLALMPWVVFALAWLIVSIIGKTWSRSTRGALILTAGLGNTSFVGFPLLEALVGPDSLRYGVVVDQFGSFLVLSLVGIPLAAYYGGASIRPVQIAKRVATFPPFLALLGASLWFALGMPGEEMARTSLEKIAGTLVPLALFAVGFQLRPDKKVLKRRFLPLALGLAYKQGLAPLVFFAVCSYFISVSSEVAQVVVLQAGMAPMITAAIVAGEFELDSETANLMVAIGIPLSLLNVPLLHLLF